MKNNLIYKWIVYLTTNLTNGKIYIGVHKTENPDIFCGYIGDGVNIFHPSSYINPQTPFQHAVKKYGTQVFKRNTIKIFNNEKDAYLLEALLVDSDFILRKDTYNVKLGGQGGSGMLKEVYQYDLNWNFINKFATIKEAAQSINESDVTLTSKIFKKEEFAKFFWTFSEIHNPPKDYIIKNRSIFMYNQLYEFEQEFESIQKAAEFLGVRHSNISRAIYGKYLIKNHYFSEEKLGEFIPKSKTSIKGKQIFLYNLDGTFYKAYNSPKECAKEFGLNNTSSISAALRLKSNFKKKYQVSLEKVPFMEDKTILNLKKIGQYDLNGNLIKEYPSKSAAIMAHGSGVNKVLRGIQKVCHGFVFKYLS